MRKEAMITLNDIKEAKKRLTGTVLTTPLVKAPILSKELNTQVYLKEDNLQLTGSFKIRGAFNRLASMDEKTRGKGVVAASAGNHAQGLAYTAQYFGCEATIFMPEATPLTKISGVKSYGADVVLTGENFDEAYATALKFATENNKEFIHPFADDAVIAGQGTIALEILDKLEDMEHIIVPIGGGGLISGIAIAAKTINPNIKITGVVSSGARGMKESFEARMPIDSDSVKTIADGIAVRDVTPKLLDIILEYVDEIVQVNGGNLSLGMQKIIILVRGILKSNHCNVLIIDEPLASLDQNTVKKVLKMIKEECANKTLLIITHDKAIYPMKDINMLKLA